MHTPPVQPAVAPVRVAQSPALLQCSPELTDFDEPLQAAAESSK